jgi:hypothetical protein
MIAFVLAIALAVLSAVAASVVALVVNASALPASHLLIRGLMRLFWLGLGGWVTGPAGV